MSKTKLKKKSLLPNRDSVLPVVKPKPTYFNDCYWCDVVHIYYPDLSSAAVKRICIKCKAEQQVNPGPTCMCPYWTNVRGRTAEDAKKICLKCTPVQDRQPVYKPVPLFDLNALIASVPFPRFRSFVPADGWWEGKGITGDSPDSSQNGPSFPQTSIQGRGIPPLPSKRKEGHVLNERKALPVPTVANKPDTRNPGTLPTVERDGKKPKIVLCGQRFGLSYIFLWMGSAGWSHTDLETFCDKLSIELPSPNTTQSRLRAGKQNNDCYGAIPVLSKKQEALMSNTILKRRK